MIILHNAVRVVVVHAEPPVVVADKLRVNLREEGQIGVHLVELERRPPRERRLRDRRRNRERPFGDDTLVIDRIGDHAVVKLLGQHHADLIPRERRVHPAIGQRVEVGVPLPDADVQALGRHHRLVLEMPQRGDEVTAHDPPRIERLLAEALVHGGRGVEPGVPARLGGGQRLAEGHNVAPVRLFGADAQRDRRAVLTLDDHLDAVPVRVAADGLAHNAGVRRIAEVAHGADIAPIVVGMRQRRRDDKPHARAHAGRHAQRQRRLVLKRQAEGAEPRFEEQGVRVGYHLNIERRTHLVYEAQAADERRAAEVVQHARLDIRHALGNLDVKRGVAFPRGPNQDARAPVAERCAAQPDAVAESAQVWGLDIGENSRCCHGRWKSH